MRGPHLEIWSIISSWPCIWQSCFRCLGVARGVQVLDFSGDAEFRISLRELHGAGRGVGSGCQCTGTGPVEFVPGADVAS